jgi:hypothetical protein
MTLLDAPDHNRSRAWKRRIPLISAFVFCGIVGIGGFLCWNLPAEHSVNEFFAAVEANNLPKAFGIWNNDPDWQQHTERYAVTGYPYGRFVLDWGTASERGRIISHKILHSTSGYGNNTLIAVEINDRETDPLVLAVARSNHSMSFPPFNLTQMKNVFGWTYWQLSYR